MAVDPTTPLGVLAVGGGVVLVWSAFTGQNPLTELRKALTTGRLDGPDEGGEPFDPVGDEAAVADVEVDQGDDDGPGETGGGTVVAPDVSGPEQSPRDPAQLVSIGQGQHRLIPGAATAFRQAEQNFGRQITVTDSYRSYAQQKAAYDRDPTRFANPDKSAHVEGRAVDVHLPALGIRSGTMDEPAYRKLVEAMTAAGWCNWQLAAGGTGGKIAEPWHFSWQVCK